MERGRATLETMPERRAIAGMAIEKGVKFTL
jgi:hypothetical protein